MLRRLTFAVALIAPLCASAIADELTPQKAADITRLLEMTGSVGIAEQFANAFSGQMAQSLKASRPDIDPRAFTVIRDELMAIFQEKFRAPGGLIDETIPIYDRHLSHEDVLGLIAFYQTPLGRKAIAVLPQIAAEGMQAGQRWAQALLPEIDRRIREALLREGFVPKQP